MFFSFGEFNRQPEIINEKLSDINNPPPLEELLIEDGIIEELQNKNEKFINYLNKEKIKQMIDYIIKEPKEEDHNKGHKFPFVCSKLFNVEETKVMKYFFKTNKELINEINNEKNDNSTDNKNKDLTSDETNKNFKDKEININEIHIEQKEKPDDNNNNINNDEINNENNIHNNNNNQNKDNEDMVNQDNKEINTINNNDKDFVNKNNKMILLKSPDLTINNSNKNKRYEVPDSEKENNIEIKNKDENNKHEESKGVDKVDNNINNVQDMHDVDPEDKIELLDYFFSFLLDDSELNYVLCGYFSSLMINLLNINSVVIIKYLFMKRKDILKRLVYHSYRKSIAETLCRVIKYEDKFNAYNNVNNNKNDYNQKEFSIIRAEIIKDIFDKIDINMDTEKLNSLSFIINDLIENKIIFDLILNNKSIIQSLVNKQLKDINLIKKEKEDNKKNNFIIIIDMIINWLNNINNNDRQIPMLLYEVDEDLGEEDDFVQQREKDNIVPEVHHTALSQALFDILPNLIKNNFNKNNSNSTTDNNNNGNDDFILQSYNDYKLKPLGLYRIKIVELLTSLISYCKNIPNEFDELLINSNFFNNAWDYIFEYQWNNLYQESFFQFLKKLLAYDKDYPYHEKSAEYLFSKMNILNLIITKLNYIKNNNENDGNSGSGYTAFLVSLSYKINVIIGGNYINLNKSYTREGSITFTKKGENPTNNVMLSNFDFDKNTNENNEKDADKLKPVECMKKYCNDEWNNFFIDNISNKIKIYEEKLCQLRNSLNDDDLFANNDAEDLLAGYKSKDEDLFGDNNNNKNEEEDLLGAYKSRDEELFGGGNNNNEEEDLLGGYKSRDEELFGEPNNNEDDKDDLVNIDDDRNDKNDKNNFNKINNNNINNRKLISTDMEINLNDFNFVDEVEEKKNDKIKNDEIKSDDNNVNNVNKENKDNEVKNANKENEEKNDTNNTYNSVNFWKNSLEKENNSYLNNLGEEALNDLSE